MTPRVEFNLPYLSEFGTVGTRRPYLWLQVTGLAGSFPIRGIIDSGADRSSLPGGWAVALGLDPTTATIGQGSQVHGTFPIWEWPDELDAEVYGEQAYSFKIHPIFVPGSLNALWGRSDFLTLWDLSLDEENQSFALKSKAQRP